MSEHSPAKKTSHSVDLRISIPWIFGRSYFVFLAGKDRRHEQIDSPKQDNRQNTPAGLAFFAGTFLLWAVVAALIASVIVLYVLKSWVGIDLVEGGSPLQEILHSLRVCHNIRR